MITAASGLLSPDHPCSDDHVAIRWPLIRMTLLGSAYDHIDLTAAALGADQPLSPIGHRRCRAVPLGHLGGVGLNLVAAILAPDDQPDAGGGVAKRHRRAAIADDFTSL
jgi:hypothetical protein